MPQLEVAQIELDSLSCPSSCFCQYAPFDKLPVARWVKHMTSSSDDNSDDDILMLSNIKLATCMLQQTSETQELLSTLPFDLHALILMHAGGENNQLTGGLQLLTFQNILELFHDSIQN